MLRLRWRLALTAIAATGAALLVVLALLAPGLREQAQRSTGETLWAEARLMALVVEEPLLRGASVEELDALIDAAAPDAGARITIVAPDGRVVADSAASGAALLALENHGGRREVQAALREGQGQATRRSATVGQDLLYVAVAVKRAGRVLGVARVARPLQGIAEQAAALRRPVAASSLLAFLITALLSTLLSAPVAGPIREIMAAARQFANGNLGARIRVLRDDELGELSRILNRTANRLQDRLAEHARDRARTGAILAAMEEGVLAVDQRGSVILANQALREALKEDAPVGAHYLEVVRQREVGALIERVLATGERRVLEVELRRSGRWYALGAAPFPGAEGAPHGAVLTFHDVTERRRVEQVRRDFVANASHDLRTPLTSIRGFVEALEDGALEEPQHARRFLGKIRAHADRMTALIDDLLELSRLESRELRLQVAAFEPRRLAEELLASFASVAAKKDLRLVLTDTGPARVVTDGERLRRLLENLLDNAIKYTPAGGRVELKVAPLAAEDGAVFEVIDDGPGIAAEHLSRLFERFYRVDKARSRELGGTGLGLSIAKHLAESMGASLRAESELGSGSRFVVAVPSPAEAGLAGSGPD
jgi:two-component system phosphate regulon sensor histidine kinase PhoR